MNRRKFLSLAGTGIAGVALVGCGSKSANPQVVVTKIPNVAGVPPTLAPNATPPNTSGSTGAASPAAGGGAAATFNLEAHDPYNWSTKKFTIEAGGTVTVKNIGVLPHDFSVDALKIAQPLDPGKTYEVKIPADAKPGDYEFYCNVPGHKAAGMFGTMTVVAPGAGGGQAQPAGGGQSGGAATFKLEAHDPFNWSVKQFTIEAGGTVTVTNTGVLPHDFSVDALKIAQPLDSGKTYEVKIPDDAKPGDYEFYCNIPGHKAAGMFGTMTVVAKGAGGQAQPAGGGQAGGAATFSLEAHDPYNWSTKKFTIEAGGTVTVKNTGVLPHDFSVDALKIAQPLDAGKTYEVKIPDDAKPGDYEFYCNVPGHKAAGMFGTMTVVAKGSAAAAPPAAATQGPAQTMATPPAASGPAGSPAATPSSHGGVLNVPIEAGDNYFNPNAFTIPANTEVIVTITNVGKIPHDFVIDQLKVQSKLVGPGESTTVKINAPAGKYEYYCAQPGHRQLGMYGTMTVEAGAASPAAVSPAAASPAAASPAAASPAASPVTGGGSATTVTVDMGDLFFKPNKFQIPANTEVSITVKNVGVLPHDFNIDKKNNPSDPNIHSPVVDPGKDATVKVKLPAGNWYFYCNQPGHEAAGMHGTITVQ